MTENEREELVKEIKILHVKINELMKKQGILERNIERWYKDLGKIRSTTKKYVIVKQKIERNQNKNRNLSKDIIDNIRKKDKILEQFSKKYKW